MSDVMDVDLNSLVVSETVNFEPVFDDPQEFEDFRERYCNEVQPKLKEQEEARRRSVEEARHRFIS